MIEIMNLRTVKPSQPFDVKVDRSSPLGNPFFMADESQRSIVCEKYKKYFYEQIQNEKFMSEVIRLTNLYKQHGKLRLFCWCAPKQCHAETIKNYITTTNSTY